MDEAANDRQNRQTTDNKVNKLPEAAMNSSNHVSRQTTKQEEENKEK